MLFKLVGCCTACTESIGTNKIDEWSASLTMPQNSLFFVAGSVTRVNGRRVRLLRGSPKQVRCCARPRAWFGACFNARSPISGYRTGDMLSTARSSCSRDRSTILVCNLRTLPLSRFLELNGLPRGSRQERRLVLPINTDRRSQWRRHRAAVSPVATP